ncbi:MAG: toxin-antitoxin system HicB family antitoxin [Candidatus Methylomirabilales bacterium]
MMASTATTISTRIKLSEDLHRRLVVEAGMQRISQNELLTQILDAALPACASARPVPQGPRELTVTTGPTGQHR